MAGHSHWAGIKHKKAVVDAKRGKLWTKLSKTIIVAAKMGGGDPDGNATLRSAIAEAKSLSMPKDNIERAIKRGTGELGGAVVEEILYEGYGPEGVAVLCDIMTDNRNRTAPEVRKIFEVHGGKLGATGCVAWMFDRKGLFVIASAGIDEEKLMDIALEAGAEDVKNCDDFFEVVSDPDAFTAVGEALDAAEIKCESRLVTRIPQNTVKLESSTARQVLRLVETLDDHDDVQTVSANFELPEEIMAELAGE